MIKRGKKKWKTKKHEVHNIQSASQSDLGIQSRNNLTASNKNFAEKQKKSRGRKKMKSVKNRSKFMWQRSKSVPPKTVSFCPYVIHRFAHAPARVKADSCRSNSGVNCRVRSMPKKTVPCRKKQSTNRIQNTSGVPCMSSDNLCSAHEQRYKVCESPGPSSCSLDPMSCDTDYTSESCSRSSHVYGYGKCGESPGSSCCTHGNGVPYTSYNPGCNNIVSSSYGNEINAVCSPWFSDKRYRQCSPGLKNWGTDAKYDFLMAKYSEHNCPKTHPARADYFSFQRHSLDGNHNYGNQSMNKSPIAWFIPRSATHSRSNSRTRMPQMSKLAPVISCLRSPYNNLDNSYCTVPSAPVTHTCQKYCINNGDLYQSETMRDLMYDSMSSKYIHNSYTDSTSRTPSAKSDSDISSMFNMYKSPKPSFISTDTQCCYGSCFGMNTMRSNKYDFADDMKLTSSSFHPSAKITFQSKPRSSKAQIYTQRSRSTDASYASGSGNFDSDSYLQCKYNVGCGGENIKDMYVPYDSWKKFYEKFDNRNSTRGKFGNWRNGHAQSFDDIKPSSKYSSSSLARSCCANNSNEKASNLYYVPDAKLGTKSTLYDRNWVVNKKTSDPWSYTKSADTDSYTSKFDEVCDKYSNWRNFHRPDCDKMSNLMSEEAKGGSNKINTKQDAANIIQGSRLDHISAHNQVRDYTSLCSLNRERSWSPVCRRNSSSFHCSKLNSYNKSKDFSLEHTDGLLSGSNCEPLGTKDKTRDTFILSSELGITQYDKPKHFNSSSCKNRNSVTANVNQSQNSGTFTDFPANSDFSRHSVPRAISKCTDSIFPEQTSRNSSYVLASTAPNVRPCDYNHNTAVLSCLVDQETDRLMKLAGVIERQKDISQNDME